MAHDRCRYGRHLWAQAPGGFTCLRCGRERPFRRRLSCLVDLHNWTLRVSEGERYVACRNCGRYGGEAGKGFAAFTYREDGLR